MTKLAMTAIAAVLLATPVLAQTVAGDAEIQGTIDWQNTVAKAAADHGAKATGDVAAVKGTSTTDANKAPSVTQTRGTTETGRYNRMEDYWADRS
jgi:hypothetical protein